MNLEPFTFVLERLGQLSIDEVKFLLNDKEKLLANLKQEVELAQSFVRDVEEAKQQAKISHVLETEVQHIMDILPQIDDFLDTFYLEKVQPSQQKITCFPKFMASFSLTSNPLVHRHVVIKKTKQLTNELQAIRKKAEPYQQQINHFQVTQRRRPQTQPYIINDDFIVGLEEDVETLIPKLVGNDDEHTTILAIAGMGGSGKTTLARKLYNRKEIMMHFSGCHAWVCVSKEWDTPQLLRCICENFHIPLPEDKSLVPYVKLREFLQGNTCLVVLDDVWEKEALQELLPLLLQTNSSKESGRVLVTTRNEEILSYPTLSSIYIHKVRPLTAEESWDLFLKIVRNKWQGITSFDESKFAIPGKKMLEKCFGLPLAIIALAGLLSTRNTIQEWETLKDNVMSMILTQNKGFHDYGPVGEMLELSYSDLSYDLKPCFLYLGIFPEDSDIDLDDLTQLWIGEGFLKTTMCNQGQTLEELARDFLECLIQRCMVQVSRRDYRASKRDYGEKAEYIRVHDLMRDLCIEKARKLKFFDISSPSMSHSISIMQPMSPRAIIHNRKSNTVWNPRLRSVIATNGTKLELTHEKMKLLRVVHLINVDLGDLGEQIEKLIHLRYLSIQGCVGMTNKFLESIKKLKYLLTLTYGYNHGVTIPNNVVDGMESLRHLDLIGDSRQSQVLGVRSSTNLQHLHTFAGDWLSKELNTDSRVDSLRELKLDDITRQTELEAVYEFVSNPSNHLHLLHLDLWPSVDFDLQKMNLKYCQFLKWLKIHANARKQPESLSFPPNLLSLSLYGTEIEKEKDLEIALAQLHQLRQLKLAHRSYTGDKLTMTGLPQLQSLQLYSLPNLKEWRIEEGALCQLRHLAIDFCEQLERIPEGISGIHTLQRLYAFSMSKSVCERLRRPSEKEASGEGIVGGEDFHLIRHIPDIHITDIPEGAEFNSKIGIYEGRA